MLTWDQLRQHFQRDGFLFTEREGPVRALEAEVQLADGTLELQVTYDEENGIVRFSAPELDVPRRLPRSRAELRKALLLLNSYFILGGFSEAPQGRLAFTITVLIEGNELPYGAYRRMLNSVVVSVERSLPWLRQVALGALSAEEAVENVLEMSRRVDGRRGRPAQEGLGGAPEPVPGGISEDELEQFGRALMEGTIPPPDE